MPKYTAYFETTATASVTIDVPDGMTDPEQIAEYAYEHGEMPRLCAQCGGWGRPFSMDLGEWETSEHGDGPHKGTALVTDADGNEITGDSPEVAD